MAMRSMFNSYNQQRQGGGRLPTTQPAFTAEQDRLFAEKLRKQIEANPDAFQKEYSDHRALPPPSVIIAARNGNTGFDTTLPTQAPTGSTVFNPVAPPSGSVPSGGNVGAVTGGAVLSGLLTGNLGDALRGAGEYYLGQEGVEGAYQTGVTGLEMAQQLGQQAAEAAQFKPYTVTSNLARIGTDPSGGFTTQLSPEQQALQNQIMGQAGGFFSQLQADPAAVQADIYESIRATQRPEEERQRLALEERMLSQGRLGLSSAAYGGASPELLAQETARQEAMARANLGARQQALAEQQQVAGIAGGLLGTGYMPQQQALALLEASRIPAQLQQTGQLSGAELQSQLGGRGIESYMQGADLANRLQLQQQQGLLTSLLGQQPTIQEQLMSQYLGVDLGEDDGLLSYLGFGDAPTPDWIKNLNPFGRSREEFDVGDISQIIGNDYSNVA